MPYAYTCKKGGEHPTTNGRTTGSNERKSRDGSSLKTEDPKMKETLTNMYKPQTNMFKGLLGNFTDQKLPSKWTVTVIRQIVVISRLNRLPFKR